MKPEDKAILSALLDNEASPAEVEAALALLERSPELMGFVERQSWLQASWRKEYSGPPLDLASGIWSKIDSPQVGKHSSDTVVDELAQRREALGMSPVASTMMAHALEEHSRVVPHPVVLPLSKVTAVQDEQKSRSWRAKRWWQPMAQFAVAASVCFVVVGLWTQQGVDVRSVEVAALGADQEASRASAPVNARVAQSQTAVASQLVAANNRATVAAAGQLSGPLRAEPVLVAPSLGESLHVDPLQDVSLLDLAQGLSSGVAPNAAAPDAMEAQFVSLDSLAAQDRARIQAYYMMHTGNSALMQPLQGMQLVRIVDAPREQEMLIPAAVDQ